MGGSPVRAIARIIKPTPPPTPIITAPTTAEVSQSNATDVTYDARKTKAKGRSMTIMTGPKGIEDETLTLGRRSLLGK